jgi:hypothetical protein
MLGLMVLLAIGLYFVILMVATYWGYRFFKNRSRKSAIYSGTTVFLAIFLPVFWDWIPTIIAHDYYCKQTGVTEFKPVEQWKKENPGVWETLRSFSSYPSDVEDEFLEASGKKDMDYQGVSYRRRPINERISEYAAGKQHEPLLVFTATRFLYDEQKQEILVMSKRAWAGPGNSLELSNPFGFQGLKLWLNLDNRDCGSIFDLSPYREALSNPALDPENNRK